jgi:hypothetical protein
MLHVPPLTVCSSTPWYWLHISTELAYLTFSFPLNFIYLQMFHQKYESVIRAGIGAEYSNIFVRFILYIIEMLKLVVEMGDMEKYSLDTIFYNTP